MMKRCWGSGKTSQKPHCALQALTWREHAPVALWVMAASGYKERKATLSSLTSLSVPLRPV